MKKAQKIKKENIHKKDGKRFKTVKILLIIIILLIVLAGILCYIDSKKEKLIGGDKDAHGCLVAAGYSWCPSTDKCQRMWEEYCEEYKEQYAGVVNGSTSVESTVNP